MENMATPYGIAIHHGNDGLWQGPDLLLHIQDIQARYTVLPDIPCKAFDMLVASAAKGFVACAGKNNNRYFFPLTALRQGIRNFQGGIGCKGIAIARPVNGDPGYPFKKVKQDIFVTRYGLPVTVQAHTGFLN
jgi:hypothetical protein